MNRTDRFQRNTAVLVNTVAAMAPPEEAIFTCLAALSSLVVTIAQPGKDADIVKLLQDVLAKSVKELRREQELRLGTGYDHNKVH